jgi:Orsellinic acid/F9775 biosynthesis cluster protein D
MISRNQQRAFFPPNFPPQFSLRMINGPEYLLYLLEQQVLICRSCQYCLQPNGVRGHLQRKHQAIPLKVRKELVIYAESLTLRDPSKVVTPAAIIPAFEGLKVTPGYCCSICGSLYGTIGSIEEHCTKAHGWTESEGTSHS